MTATRLVWVALLLLSQGCKTGKPPEPEPPSFAGQELVEPNGSSPADLEVRAAQARVKAEESPEAWLGLGEAWLRRSRVSGEAADGLIAEAAASKAESLGAKNASGVRAAALLNRQRFEEARSVAEATLLKIPRDLRSLAVLSDALLELGRVEESGVVVQKMVDLKPGLPSYGRASWLRWLAGDVAGARQIIRLALDAARDPRDVEARAWTLCQAASYFWHEGDFEGAEAGYDQALRLIEDYPPALVGKARCALARDQAARAAPLLRLALAKQPTVETAILRAQVLGALGDPGEDAAWSEAGALGGGWGLARVWTARNRNLDQALALLEKERGVRPTVGVLDAHAWALFRAGRLAEAEEAGIAANRLGTRDARLWFHLGAIRFARGQREEGRVLVGKALELNPAWDPVEVTEARRLLAEN